MKKLYTVVLVVVMLLTSTGYTLADGPVGADCTEPPNLVPLADLRNCDLSGRNMAGVNLYSAKLSGANLSNADLSGADLSGADLANANLNGAILDNASLFTTNLVAATFDNASLRNTNLDDGYAPGASFINADLRGANLYFAFIRDADLSGANFSNAYLNNFDVVGSILQNAIFTGTELFDVDMQNTDLRGADLSFTTLSYVSLNNADLRNANLLGAERKVGTSLDGIIWGNTACSDGSNSDDNDGDNFTCESNFLGNQPPTVSLMSPADNTTVTKGSTVTISATAADSDGSVIRVEFFAGSTLLNTDPSAPYSFDWTTTVTGAYVITARATDNDGAVTTSQSVTVNIVPSPNNVPPTVTITSPANNATINRSSGTTIGATANDSDGTIIKAVLYAGSTLLCIDTSAPFSCFWKPTVRGTFTLTVRAYDDDGAVTTSAPVTVRVR
ncbi:MAG TPA: pentapeptide repeat-containing protein [Anaerolineales bacterium]|nr:pentapeptide repeat-containing protein [Anaerolineales bacterium]